MGEALKFDHGEKVRIRSTPLTESKGLAGLVGQVHGWTTPSVTGPWIEEIIGDLKQDYAVNVHFEKLGKGFWFSEDLVELIGRGPWDVKVF
jgi:hypothetical protein